MVGNTRQGWTLLGVMLLLLVAAFGVLQWAESSGNPLVAKLGVQGVNMEGKEVRFGLAGSNLFDGGHHRHLLRRGRQPCTTP